MDTVLIARAIADTLATAQPDSAIVNVIFNYIEGLAPWLTDSMSQWIATWAAAIPIVASVFGKDVVVLWLSKLSPWLRVHVFSKGENWSWVINPLLAGLVAYIMTKDSGLGLAAGGVWSTIDSVWRTFKNGQSINKTIKSKIMGALLVLGLLGVAGTSSAEPLKWNQRLGFAVGTGFEVQQDKWVPQGDPKPWVAGYASYLLPFGAGATNSTGWAASLQFEARWIDGFADRYSLGVKIAP